MSLSPFIIELSKKLRDLKLSPSFDGALEVAKILAHLLQNKNTGDMKILNVTRHGDKVSGWFNFVPGMDIPASYQYTTDLPVDFKVYWLQKTGKQRIAGCVNFTENFEDDQVLFFDKNVGVDVIIPNTPDRIFVVLSSGYKLRMLELEGELSVTQQEILQKWGQDFGGLTQKTIHEVLWQSFNLKSLNQKFYEGIARKFTELAQHLILSGEIEHDAKHFTNRLIGRIIFLWFLRKKNIINEKYGYFIVDDLGATEYYQRQLSPLFFDTLNKPVEERGHADIITPYLNGGLFESRGIDRKEGLSFPKTFFRDLYEFLAEYNFTTDESTSSFEQVAIDPEMLGRIFENLLAEQVTETGEQARKAKGAFYTPREIVDYMCVTTLKTYIEKAIENNGITISDREKIIKHLFEDTDAQFALYKKNESYDAITKNRGTIISVLDRLTVLDPACGSGAFPMGMMQAMIRAYERTLTEAKFDATGIKLGIIERSLFGVDIEPMAVEIARLRAWLSIIVDEPNDSKLVKPLPNLDFKFICANSLIPLTTDKQGQFGDDLNREDRMQTIRQEYFKTNSRPKKEKLRKEFEMLIGGGNMSFDESIYNKQLSSYHIFDPENSCEFFDPKFMFGIEKGFDVVIGNPPYVSLEKIKENKDVYKKYYETFSARGDLYCLFYERGLRLLKEHNGLLAFITSHQWMRAGYGKKLRAFFLMKNPIMLIDLGPGIFESATVDTNIIFVQNRGNQDVLKGVNLTKLDMTNISQVVNLRAINLKNTQNDNWFIGSDSECALKEKLEQRGKSLKEWDIKINFGLKTGFNEAFIISQEKRDELLAIDSKNADLIKPILRGRDIQKYGYYFDNLWLIAVKYGFSTELEKYPAILNHLKKFEVSLKARGQCNTSRTGVVVHGKTGETGQHHWLELDNNPTDGYLDLFQQEKIVWKRIGSVIRFGYDPGGMWCQDSTCIMTGSNLKYLCAFLNSNLGNMMLYNTAPKTGTGDVILSVQALNPIRIPEKSAANMSIISEIERLFDQIILAKEQQDTALVVNNEKKINELIYRLYDLTPEEIVIIENSIK